MAAVPYKDSNQSKKVQVEEMFDQISHRYDLLNHLLSVNIDKLWRNRAIKMLKPFQPQTILDIATGTADFAIAAGKLNPGKITGIDLSEGMLRIGRRKVNKKGLSHLIELRQADSEALPFENHSFDAAIVGFGVRNFENLEKGKQKTNMDEKKALKMARVYNTFICTVIKGSSDWTLENGKRTIIATLGITLDGIMRNKVGTIAEDRVRTLIFEWLKEKNNP